MARTKDFNDVLKESHENFAMKITVSGSYTYIGKAELGTTQATAKWQCKRIDESVANSTVITWCDGDDKFDNVATDLTALTYV